MKKPTGSKGTRQARAHTDSTATPTKQARILRLFVDGNSLNRFEAERIGDHALPSTVSTLRHGYGLEIIGTPETVPTRFGKPSRCKRYHLPEAAHGAALALLAQWESAANDATAAGGEQ